MARNKLTDLNDHLFAQLERLGDEEMDDVQVELEVKRAKAITGISKNIIDNARVCLDAVKVSVDKLHSRESLPDQFQLKKDV